MTKTTDYPPLYERTRVVEEREDENEGREMLDSTPISRGNSTLREEAEDDPKQLANKPVEGDPKEKLEKIRAAKRGED